MRINNGISNTNHTFNEPISLCVVSIACDRDLCHAILGFSLSFRESSDVRNCKVISLFTPYHVIIINLPRLTVLDEMSCS